MDLVILIMGCHRSGTSLLAGLLKNMGCHAGDSLYPANEYNERGYFESGPIVELNESLLASCKRSWDDVRSLPSKDGDEIVSIMSQNMAKQCFLQEFNGASTVVLKDPRISKLFHWWSTVFDDIGSNVFSIISIRDPLEVAASLQKRDGFPLGKGLLIYLSYLLDAEFHTRGRARAVVDYKSTLADWRAMVAGLKSCPGLHLPILTPDLEQRIDSLVMPNLRHNRGDVSVSSGIVELSALAYRVYEGLRSLSDDGSNCVMDKLRVCFNAYLEKLEPWINENDVAVDPVRETLSPNRISMQWAGRGARSTVYWRSLDTNGFSELKSVFGSWKYGADENSVNFVFPEFSENINGIRLDITDRPAFVKLKWIILKNPLGTAEWVWWPGLELPGTFSSDIYVSQNIENGREGLSLIISGFDPQILLDIPEFLLRRVGAGWALSIKFLADLLISAIPGLVSASSDMSRRLECMQELQGHLGKLVDEARITLAQKSEDLLKLRRALTQCQAELERAHAQLTLAKESNPAGFK